MSRQPRHFFNRPPPRSIYAYLRVPGDRRARFTPRIARPWRHKLMAWRGILAFYSDNRFYDIDRFYKAYIPKPMQFPDIKVIKPELYTKTMRDILEDEKLEEYYGKDMIDIGLAYIPLKISDSQKLETQKKNKVELEQSARLRTLKVDPKEIEEENMMYNGPEILRKWALHLNIFEDLFHPEVYFNPVVPFTVEYEDDIDNTQVQVIPVSWGNTIYPSEARDVPRVSFESEPDCKWTLLALNADGNIFKEGKQFVHWMVSNIEGNDLSTGSTIYPYLQPLPFKGTGYHRFVYLLFKHHNGADLNLKTKDNVSLKDRSFSTPEFYKMYEDIITPCGLAIFQCEWDASVKDKMHELGELHPIFQFSEPPKGLDPQEEIPLESTPFNEYLEKYRPDEEIEEEILRKRIQNLSPFWGPASKPKYPGLDEYAERKQLSSWHRLEKRKINLGEGKYEKLYKNVIEV